MLVVDTGVNYAYPPLMDTYHPYELAEVFHLSFLRFLESVLSKHCYALKGGCNLRFFFKSIRCSEDMDLDVWELGKDKVKDAVRELLESKSFQQALNVLAIELHDVRAPKQTETTQRWKMSLRQKGSTLALPTKIEFSCRERNSKSRVVLEAVDGELNNRYTLPLILVPHYNRNSAALQKLHALMNRREPQARDVFDLHLLFSKDVSLTKKDLGIAPDKLEEQILSIDYEMFFAQVVSYLEASFRDYYANKTRFESMQLELIERLDTLCA